ncbi:MAG: hypothetical protein IT261_12755 [Saprospiraceae bacterium]|nr:hypothetical protein [Saprospiraceae bacterium]
MENNNVDKGWEAMRAMLDREMPVKKRRRAAWWWLSLLLIPGLILADWWYHQSERATTPPSQPPTELTLAQSIKPGAVNHSDTPTRKSQEAYMSVTTTDKSGNKPTVQYTQKHPPSPTTPTEYLTADNPEKPISIPETTVSNLSQQPAALTITSIKPVITIPSQPGLTFRVPPVSSQALPSSPVFKPHWEIGATSMASSEQFNNINGFSTGVTADWAFSRKWGLRTGLLYNIHTPQESHRPVVTVNAADYTSDLEGDIVARNVSTGTEVWNMPGVNTLADSLSGDVYIPVNRLQRIELPVQLFWQASQSIKVLGGFSVAKTLVTKADRLNYSGEYQLTLNDQIAEQEISNLSGHQMNSWNVNAMIGLGWRISPVFELGLNGTLPLQRYNNLGASTSGNMTNQEVRIKAQRTPLFGMYGTLYF